VRDERVDGSRLEVVRRDDRDGVGADVLSMRRQRLAVAHRERAHVHDDQQAPAPAPHPFLHHGLALGDRAGHALAGRAADVRAVHAALDQQVGLLLNDRQVHVPVPIEGRVRGGDEARQPLPSLRRGRQLLRASHGTLQPFCGFARDPRGRIIRQPENDA